MIATQIITTALPQIVGIAYSQAHAGFGTVTSTLKLCHFLCPTHRRAQRLLCCGGIIGLRSFYGGEDVREIFILSVQRISWIKIPYILCFVA
jgi:hypothetical protein